MSNDHWWIEEAHKSGLAFDSNMAATAQWREQSSEMNPGWRQGHASVVLDDDTVVVLGGIRKDSKLSSVILLPPQKKWMEAPSMNDGRWFPAVVICNDFVYALGGSRLDTIERTSVATLKRLAGIVSNGNINNNSSSGIIIRNSRTMSRSCSHSHGGTDKWERVNTRLSCERMGCSAVAVHNRFLVVMGGKSGRYRYMATVDIIDTQKRMTLTKTAAFPIDVGPSMCGRRSLFGAAVVDNRIWVVGGKASSRHRSSRVESIAFNSDPFVSSSSSLFSVSSSWTMQRDLSLSIARSYHAVCAVENCLVVLGGVDTRRITLSTVEVLDLQRRVVWKLPDLDVPRSGFSVVATSSALLAIGGCDDSRKHLDSIAVLTYVQLSLQKLITTMHEFEDSSETWNQLIVDKRLLRQQEQQQQVQEQEEQQAAITMRVAGTIIDGETTETVTLLQEQRDSIVERRTQVQSLSNTLIYYYLRSRELVLLEDKLLPMRRARR